MRIVSLTTTGSRATVRAFPESPVPRKQSSPKPEDFEKTLQDLEALVERLEQGELTLEESLQEFERGIALTRRCQQALRDAEQRVKILTEKGTEQDFQAENGNGDVP